MTIQQQIIEIKTTIERLTKQLNDIEKYIEESVSGVLDPIDYQSMWNRMKRDVEEKLKALEQMLALGYPLMSLGDIRKEIHKLQDILSAMKNEEITQRDDKWNRSMK